MHKNIVHRSIHFGFSGKYKEDKFTFSLLLLLKLEKHMHLWAGASLILNPAIAFLSVLRFYTLTRLIFCLGCMPLISDQFVNISHSVLIQPQKHQSLTDFHIC